MKRTTQVRPLSRVALLLAALAAMSCGGGELNLDQVLARHAEARGGADALESLHSLRMELRSAEPEFTVDLIYRALRPDMARADVSMDGEVVFIEAFHGSGGWQQPGSDAPVEIINPDGAAKLRRGAIRNLHALHEIARLGHTLTLLERTEIDGVLYYPVRLTFDDGQDIHYYLDPETFLVTRQRKVHALHPDIDPTEIWAESRYSDFREVDGILFPFRTTSFDLNTGEQVQETTVLSVEVNPELDASVFQVPEEAVQTN